MNVSDQELERILDAIELAEYPLLNWGVTNGSFNDAELDKIINSVLPGVDPSPYKAELEKLGLIFRTPMGTYRSRIAEFLRLTTTLRQWFRGKRSDESQLLVHDTKFNLRQRAFPSRRIPKSTALNSLEENNHGEMKPWLASLIGDEFLLSDFQSRSLIEVLNALAEGKNRSLAITAGTGSGKTNAYFWPMYTWLAHMVAAEGHRGPRTLALYPRTELLKDQLENALIQVRQVNAALVAASKPTIRVGVWYGAVPTNIQSIQNLDSWKKTNLENSVKAYICPFLRCSNCLDAEQMNLVILESNVSKRKALLQCRNSHCSYTVTESELVFTRDSLTGEDGKADVLFTTTESLNRQLAAGSGEKAFGLSPVSALKTILVDEAHVYEGFSGAQTAFLFRRLRNRVQHPMTWVSLSATLDNPKEFISDLVYLDTDVIAPLQDEMEYRGAEYIVAARHYMESKKSPLSTAIQLAMLMSRILDPKTSGNKSRGFFGSKVFAFADKLDVINRFYFGLSDAEGSTDAKGVTISNDDPRSLATLRGDLQGGHSISEPSIQRYRTGQWWKACEDLGHKFLTTSFKKIGLTSSQSSGVDTSADVVVATASLEVGFDDDTVGAVLQYKMPRSAAGFLQRKGRAGRTQKMRPLTTIVLSPYGSDKAAWSNAENYLFQPSLPARRLPMSNRYTHKMQAVYVLLDWLHAEVGVSNSWWLLAGKNWSDQSKSSRDRAVPALKSLLDDPRKADEFGSYLQNALGLSSVDAWSILWSHPRGLLTSVVPTAIRRLESGFAEDGRLDKDPLREFAPANLFTSLNSPEVSVELPPLPGAQSSSTGNIEYEFLPIERILREFTPGNTSRHFGKHAKDRHWVKVDVGQTQLDVIGRYQAVDTGLRVIEDGIAIPIFRPTHTTLDWVPDNYGDGTSAYPEWGVSLKSSGQGKKFDSRIQCWDNQTLKIETFLHSNGSNVLLSRYSKNSRGWTSPAFGDKERIDVSFEAGSQKVYLGMDLEVDGLLIDLLRPQKRPSVSNVERSDRLEFLIKEDDLLIATADPFELERVAKSIIYLIAKDGGPNRILGISDDQLAQEIYDAGQAVILDFGSPDLDERLDWFESLHAAIVRRHLQNVLHDRDDDWNEWFDKRIATALGALVLDVFRGLIPDLDSDDLVLDIQIDQDDEKSIQIWINEQSPGGNGGIERIAEELELISKFDSHMHSMLKARELEKLDGELRQVATFALNKGNSESQAIRNSWAIGHKDVELAIEELKTALRSENIFFERSAMAIFLNRFMGPGADASLLHFLLQFSQDWDNRETSVKFELTAEIMGLLWQQNSSFDAALHLSSPTDGRRASAIAAIAWMRPARGVALDYEVSNPFNYNMQFDVPALRSMIETDPVVIGQGQVVQVSAGTEIVLADVNDVIELTGSAEELRHQIIGHVVTPIEDDALWVHRVVTETYASNGQLVARLSSDLESI
jgi:hypothetical protein